MIKHRLISLIVGLSILSVLVCAALVANYQQHALPAQAEKQTVVKAEIVNLPSLAPTPTVLSGRSLVGSVPPQTPAPLPPSKLISDASSSSIYSSNQITATVVAERIGLSASVDTTEYVDAATGFSLRYPSNWSLDLPRHVDSAALFSVDYSVTIRNFDDRAMVKRETLNPDELKITIYVEPRTSNFKSLEDWLTKRMASWHPDTKFSQASSIEIDGTPALRRTLSGGIVPEGAVEIVVTKGAFVYTIVSSPAKSLQITSLDDILQMMKLP